MSLEFDIEFFITKLKPVNTMTYVRFSIETNQHLPSQHILCKW